MLNLPIIDLPKMKENKLFSMPLIEALQKRKTSRVFFGDEIKLVELAALLKITFGETKNKFDLEETVIISLLKKTQRITRTSPSAGAMHPTMPYVIALKVAGLNPGVYFYDFLNY